MIFDNFIGKRIYIYGFGIAGRWLSDELSEWVAGFVDSDSKKHGQTYGGKRVLSTEELKDAILPGDVIIITVIDIQDVYKKCLDLFPLNECVPVGKFLNNTRVGNNRTTESSAYIEYTLKAVEECHKSFLSMNRRFLHSVDVVITEKCSLNCKDCSNLMQYYEDPRNLDEADIVKDFEELTLNLDRIFEVRLIGGEPFMHKGIYSLITYFINHEKVNSLVVYTNATIPLKPESMKAFRDPKLVFSITDYGTLSRNTGGVIKVLEDLGISYRSMPPSNWTDSGFMKDFSRTKVEMQELFEKCCAKNLFTLMYGRLYRCPFAANAERLGGIPFDHRNSVAASASMSEIETFTNDLTYIPACNFCNGRSHDASEIVPAIQAKGVLPYKKVFTINRLP